MVRRDALPHRPEACAGPKGLALYVFSEVFDLKPTRGLYLKNSAHLSNFLTPRTVSEVFDLKPTSGLYLKNSARLFNFLTPRTVSAIGRIAAEFSAEFYFFAGFRQKRALRSGSVCSPINPRALAWRRRSRSAPAADGRASALESPTAFDRTVRSPQLADRERATQRHVGPVAVEQASRRDGAALRRYPGTSCLATISLSLRDKSHSVPNFAPFNPGLSYFGPSGRMTGSFTMQKTAIGF